MYNIFLYSLTSIHLFYLKVLLDGLQTATSGFEMAGLARPGSGIWNEKHKEEFKNDAEMFSKTAKSIDELLETTREEREMWLHYQENFEKALMCDNVFKLNIEDALLKGIKVK